jgi:hypothetical protein
LSLVSLLQAPRLQSFVDLAASPAVAENTSDKRYQNQIDILVSEMQWRRDSLAMPKTHRHLDNVVIFARLETVRGPRADEQAAVSP